MNNKIKYQIVFDGNFGEYIFTPSKENKSIMIMDNGAEDPLPLLELEFSEIEEFTKALKSLIPSKNGK